MTIVPQRRQERFTRWLRNSGLGAIGLALLVAPAIAATDDEAIGFERTPPRLSMVEGEASFWRPGAEEWTQAQVNIPLAAGDQLYTSVGTNLEVQIGPRAFLRAGEKAQFGLDALEPDYLQLRVTEGGLSLDLRDLRPGQTLEVSTPNAAFTVERAGYYRVSVDGAMSTFTSRRGGHGLVTTISGTSTAVANGEQLWVTAGDAPTLATYTAPELDSFDRWNYARTDRQINAASARYVSNEVYGLADLDDHGEWRQVPTYGSVWVPRRVAVDWAPYSSGRWIHDPFYGWSWIDHSPWGWAPFHYGRWVHVSGFWGWCPGPVVVRPFYAPALVAFYGVGGGASFSVSVGAPFGWVALGWGEPLIPWWGPAHFRGYARWGGWGGPRFVNRTRVYNNTVININEINVYENTRVRNGVVVVDRDSFGRRRVDSDRRRSFDSERMQPVRGDLPVRPTAEGLRGGDRAGRRPPRDLLDRDVVSTRDGRVARRADAPGRRGADTAAVRQNRPGDDAAAVRQNRRDGEGRTGVTSPAQSGLQPTRDAQRYAATDRRSGATRGDSARSAPPPPRAGETRRESPRAAAREDATRRRPEATAPGVRSAPSTTERRAAPPANLRAGTDSNLRAQPRRQGETRGATRRPEATTRTRDLSGAAAGADRQRFAPPPPPPARDSAPAVRNAPRGDSTRSGVTANRDAMRRGVTANRDATRSGLTANRDATRSGVTANRDAMRRQPSQPANRDAMNSRQRAATAPPPPAASSGSLAGSSGTRAARNRAPAPAAPQREVRSQAPASRPAVQSRPSTNAPAPQRAQRSGDSANVQSSVRGMPRQQQAAPRPAVRSSGSSTMRGGGSPSMRDSGSAAMRGGGSPSMRGGGSPSMRGGGSPAMRGDGSPTMRGGGSPAMRGGGATRGGRSGGDGRR